MIKVVLSSVIDIISGGTPQTSVVEYWENGDIGWLSVTDFNNDNRYVYDSEKKITERGLNESNTKLLTFGDIIISARGTVGALAQIGKPMCFNQSCFGIRGKKNKIDTDFLYYALKNYVQHIKKRSQGSVFDTINLKSFDLMELEIPSSISSQQKIAKVLSDLDAKIELNNKINTELEAMAKTLYDYWFVQFDFPNEEGKPYKSSGGKIVWNEELKREIPEGWEVNSLSSWINNDKSGDWGKEQEEGNYNQKVYCIRGADINGLNGKGEMKTPERYILEKNLHKTLETYDLIVEISGGSPVQSTGRLAYITEETLHRFDAPIICSNFCKAVTLKNKHYFYNFVYQWNSVYDAGVLFGYEGKTSGIKNLLFESFVSSYQTAIPPKELAEKFYEFMKPIQIKKEKNLKENQELASLRDWLLPMLMNGQVTVGEVSKDYLEKEDILGMVAEENDTDTFTEIINQINFDYEIAAIASLTFQRFKRSYGKKYIHKMFSNIELLNTQPIFKKLVFEEKGWGMFSSQIKKAIDDQKFIQFEEINDTQKVIRLNYKYLKEVSNWMKNEENQEFIKQVNDMLTIYENPIINKKMDNIELFNTVLECMKVLKTDDFKAIYTKMQNWHMEEEDYATKADKFNATATQHMILFIKEIKN